MLLPHEVFINGFHLVAGLIPEISSSFRYRFLWNTTEHKPTVPNNALVSSLFNSWSFEVWMLVCSHRLPSFSELGMDICLIVLASNSNSNPPVDVSFRWFGGLQHTRRFPRCSSRSFCTSLRFSGYAFLCHLMYPSVVLQLLLHRHRKEH